LEKNEVVDQKRRAVLQLVTDKQDLFERQGVVAESWRSYRARQAGPYYRLMYRDAGRQYSVYLGADPQLAAEIRQVLQTMQTPTRQASQWQRQRGKLREALRRQKHQWDTELRKEGLYLQGYEVRGYRRLAAGVSTAGDAGPATGQG
jgi:hypothetical protein